jgi:hypothetical protein
MDLARGFATFPMVGAGATAGPGDAGFPPDFATFTLLADDATALFGAVLRFAGVVVTAPVSWMGSAGTAGTVPISGDATCAAAAPLSAGASGATRAAFARGFAAGFGGDVVAASTAGTVVLFGARCRFGGTLVTPALAGTGLSEAVGVGTTFAAETGAVFFDTLALGFAGSGGIA